MKQLFIYILSITLLMVTGELQATSTSKNSDNQQQSKDQAIKLDKRKFFPISFYKTTYLLPAYYTASPDYAVYQDNTPNNQDIKKTEVKFQFSLKVPLVTNLFNRGIVVYAAYTQLSYWQAYANSAFFRETNYEPELFFELPIHRQFYKSWFFEFLNIGGVHQSNGKGGQMERSWNRIYAEGFFKNGNFVASVKPWWVTPNSITKYNDDITHYLGHGRLLLAYNFHHQIFSAELRNNIESGFKRGTQQISWSIPLTRQLKFYIQFFQGYGQSLIEYNHRTTAGGVGISLNDELAEYIPDSTS